MDVLSGYRLKDICSDTMNEYHRNLYRMALEGETDMRLHPPHFKLHSDGYRYYSDPFCDFYGDCSSCQHFYEQNGGLSDGTGICQLLHEDTSWGMTCPQHKFTETALYMAETLEEELKKEDGEPL